MIELEITKEHLQKAEILYKHGALKNSITKGKGNLCGAIGEVMALQYFQNIGRTAVIDDTYQYDILVSDSFKMEVKTKETTVKPKGYYNCSVSNNNAKQQCDYYFFVRVLKDKTKAFILGGISREDFFNKATFNKEGEPDGKFTFKSDCYNITIDKLTL